MKDSARLATSARITSPNHDRARLILPVVVLLGAAAVVVAVVAIVVAPGPGTGALGPETAGTGASGTLGPETGETGASGALGPETAAPAWGAGSQPRRPGAVRSSARSER